jgi:uncharacterized protein YeeX (DUF496 family)
MATKASVQISAEDNFSQTVRHAKAQFSGLQESIGRVTAVTGTLGGGFASLGATFVAGGLIGGIKSLVGAFDDLDEAAQGAGVGAVALAEMRTAAGFAGVGAEQLDGALTKLNVKLADAAGGGKEATAAFNAIGVSFKDAKGNVRGTEEVLRDVATAFSGYQDGAAKSALAVKFFGESGAKLVPLLNQGADGLRQFSGLSEQTVREAAKMQAEFDKLATHAERLKNAFAGAVIPAINQTIDVMERMDWKSFVGAFALGPLAITRQADLVIQATKDLEAYNKVAEENRRLLGSPILADNIGGKKAAPTPAKAGAGSGLPKAEQIDDSARALGGFVEQLQRQRDALEEVTAQEQALQFLKENPRIDTPQVRELLLNQAALTDELKAEAEMRKELARIQKMQFDEEKRLTDQVLELAGVAEEERKIALTKQLEIMVEQGRLTQEQALQAVKGIAGIKDQIKDADNFIGSLGDSMKDAFGAAVVGGEKLGDVLKRLNDRLLSMVTDNLFEKFLGSFFGGKGGSSDPSSLFGAIAGIFGGFAGGGGGAGGDGPSIGESFNAASVTAPSNVRAMGGTTVVYNIAQVGSNVSRADMASAMEQTRAATIGQIQDLSARGRLKLA